MTSSAASSSSGGSIDGQPLGQHRLAGAGRPEQREVVPAGGGHLEPRAGPAPARPRRRRSGRRVGGRLRRRRRVEQRAACPRTNATSRRSVSTRPDVTPGHQRPPRRRSPAARPPGRCPARAGGQRPSAARRGPAGQLPSRPSSPSTTTPVAAAPAAARRRRPARARRSPGRTRSRAWAGSAGSRLTVIRRLGQASPELTIAARTRSRASCSAASGRPVSDHGRQARRRGRPRPRPGGPSRPTSPTQQHPGVAHQNAARQVLDDRAAPPALRQHRRPRRSGPRAGAAPARRASGRPAGAAGGPSPRRPPRPACRTRPLRRVFTSQNTSVVAVRGQMSISPSAHRQLRASDHAAPALQVPRPPAARRTPRPPVVPSSWPSTVRQSGGRCTGRLWTERDCG